MMRVYFSALLNRWRYIKFGLVGASGTIVNLAVLYLCQEFFFANIESTQRLYASLATAILVATVNNFAWNRMWTWRDRQSEWKGSLLSQFVRYGLASWLGTSVQYIATLWLAQHMHYLLGNVMAIVVASVINYFTNDWWTFKAIHAKSALKKSNSAIKNHPRLIVPGCTGLFV